MFFSIYYENCFKYHFQVFFNFVKKKIFPKPTVPFHDSKNIKKVIQTHFRKIGTFDKFFFHLISNSTQVSAFSGDPPPCICHFLKIVKFIYMYQQW